MLPMEGFHFLLRVINKIENASFEVILFNSQHLLQILHRKLSQKDYAKIEDSLISEIYLYAKKNGYDKIINIPIQNFINNRFELYYNELRFIQEVRGAMPSRLLYYFYENPLSISSGMSRDLIKASLVMTSVKADFELLEKTVDLWLQSVKNGHANPKETFNKNNLAFNSFYQDKVIDFDFHSEIRFLEFDTKTNKSRLFWLSYYTEESIFHVSNIKNIKVWTPME